MAKKKSLSFSQEAELLCRIGTNKNEKENGIKAKMLLAAAARGDEMLSQIYALHPITTGYGVRWLAN